MTDDELIAFAANAAGGTPLAATFTLHQLLSAMARKIQRLEAEMSLVRTE